MKFIDLKKKIVRLVLSLLSFLFIVFFSGCNELPTEVGMPLMFDTVTVYPLSSNTSTVFTGQRTFQIFDSLHNNGAFMFGISENIKAAAIVRFLESNFVDSLNVIKTSSIKSVKLTLKPTKYTFGDLQGNNLSFKIYRMKSGDSYGWSKSSNWDSIFNSGNSSDLYYPAPIGQWSGNIPIIDSNSNIEIELSDKQMITEWIKDNKDSVSIWGLCFVPDQGSNVIRQFARLASDDDNPVPRISVIYTNDSTKKDDTLTAYSADYKTVIKSPAPDTTYLTVQGSTSVRSQLTFDLSFLDKSTSIYKAQLELNYIPSSVKYGSMPLDTVLEAGFFLTDSVWKNPNITYYASLYGEKYIFPKINSAVEYWIRRDGKGSLYLISPGITEHTRLDKMSFYGLEEKDPEKKPKLIIIYSKRPF